METNTPNQVDSASSRLTEGSPRTLVTADKKGFITKFLKPEALKGRGAWPREMKMMNSLAAVYPDAAFWSWYNPGFQLNSLAWFLGDGKPDLYRAHQAYLFDLKTKLDVIDKSRTLESVGIVNDLPPSSVKPKPSTLSSWLRK